MRQILSSLPHIINSISSGYYLFLLMIYIFLNSNFFIIFIFKNHIYFLNLLVEFFPL